MVQVAGAVDSEPGWSDPAELTAEGLATALAGVSAVEAAAKARFLALLGEFLERQVWEADGCVSAAQWLSWRCGLGSVAASEHIRAAQAMRSLPAVARALASGAITWSKVRAITRIATPATESIWLDVALDGTAAQVEQIVRTQRRISAADADHQEATRSLSWRQADNDDGSVIITLRIPAAEGAAVIAAVHDRTVPEAGVPIASRRADAMVELLLGPDIATPTVTIVTHPETLAPSKAEHDEPGPCATDGGIAIDPGTAAAAACDGPVITADAEGVYRQQRYPTAATRRLLALRDPTCRFPGCHHTGRREAHHLVHWIHGGSRQPDNLVLLCPGHHRLIHRHHITLRLDRSGTVTAWGPDERPYHHPMPAAAQPWPEPTAEPLPTWDGQRLDHHWIATCLAEAITTASHPSAPSEFPAGNRGAASQDVARKGAYRM
ncbi:MAG: DUF222 domain-containing protein [Acidimicrobiales bacterium]